MRTKVALGALLGAASTHSALIAALLMSLDACQKIAEVRVGVDSNAGAQVTQAVAAELPSLNTTGIHFVLVSNNPDVTVGAFTASGTLPSPIIEPNTWWGTHGVGRYKQGTERVDVDPARAPRDATLQHAIAYELLRWYGDHAFDKDFTGQDPGLLDAPANVVHTNDGDEHQFLRSSDITEPSMADLAILRPSAM